MKEQVFPEEKYFLKSKNEKNYTWKNMFVNYFDQLQ